MSAIMPNDVSGDCIRYMNVVVMMNAIGSLLPLSSSSSGRRLCLRPILRLRNTPNTAAASVEDTIEPMSMDTRNEKSVTRYTK